MLMHPLYVEHRLTVIDFMYRCLGFTTQCYLVKHKLIRIVYTAAVVGFETPKKYTILNREIIFQVVESEFVLPKAHQKQYPLPSNM